MRQICDTHNKMILKLITLWIKAQKPYILSTTIDILEKKQFFKKKNTKVSRVLYMVTLSAGFPHCSSRISIQQKARTNQKQHLCNHYYCNPERWQSKVTSKYHIVFMVQGTVINILCVFEISNVCGNTKSILHLS